MENQLTCPHCGKNIAITEALSHQVQEQLKLEREQAEKRFEEERKKMRMIAEKWREEESKRLEDKYAQTQREIETKLKEKVQKEMELKLLDTKNESEELRKEKQSLQEQILETNKLIRQLRSELDQKNIEVEKRLAQEQEKIRTEAQKRAEEEYQLKMLEKDKKLQDAMKANDDLRRKLEQGSQQMQGEVLELQIEEMLKREFPFDEVKEVPKGKLGADLIQIVRSRSGEQCGTIIWELKRTKVWSNEWIPKLKNDQREVKADIAVIISEVLPPDHKVFGHKDGVWIGNYQTVVGLATALRKGLLDVSMVKTASVGKKEKMELIWEYVNSVAFTQRIEAIKEIFITYQDDINKEKAWFNKKWAKQESSIQRIISNTSGIYGDLESIMGKALPGAKDLDIDMEEETEQTKNVLEEEKSTLF